MRIYLPKVMKFIGFYLANAGNICNNLVVVIWVDLDVGCVEVIGDG